MSGVLDLSVIDHLFHGTCARFDGAPRPGADGVFWTAESSCVAQTYIPRAPGRSLVAVRSYEMDEPIRPDAYSVLYRFAQEFGPPAEDVMLGPGGRAVSWRMPPGYLTGRELVEILEQRLGYKNQGGVCGDWKAFVLQQGGVTMPADWSLPGSLMIVSGFAGMRLADVSRGEGDLTELQSRRWGLFDSLAGQGFDGVVIDDFCQSEVWGNVGHRAIGFFRDAAARLSFDEIAATHFEWGEEAGALSQVNSPEFEQWRQQAMVLRAVMR